MQSAPQGESSPCPSQTMREAASPPTPQNIEEGHYTPVQNLPPKPNIPGFPGREPCGQKWTHVDLCRTAPFPISRGKRLIQPGHRSKR